MPIAPTDPLTASGVILDRLAEQYGVARHDARADDWVTVDISGRIPMHPLTDEELREQIVRRFQEGHRFRDDEVDALPRAIEIVRSGQIRNVRVEGTISLEPEPEPKSRWERLMGEPLI